jgi:hypothetical protein
VSTPMNILLIFLFVLGLTPRMLPLSSNHNKFLFGKRRDGGGQMAGGDARNGF